MEKNTIRVEVSSLVKSLTLDFVLHRHESEETLLISKKDFYDRFGREKLEFPHYEVEVLISRKGLLPARTHVHESGGRSFIRWPHRIPTKNNACDLVINWFAAAMHSIESGKDSNVLIGQYCGHAEAAINFLEGLADGLKKDHGIKVEILK